MGLRSTERGHAMIDLKDVPKTDRRTPLYAANIRELFPKGGNHRAYIFGNFYKSPFPGHPRQLIGLGVRIGTSPRIQDAFGNDENNVHFRGSWLRLRTDFGWYSLCAHTYKH
jgi:hypothetical protein